MLFYQTYREHVEQRALEFETVEEREYSKRELESNIQRMHYERGPRWSERVLGYHIIRVCIKFSCTSSSLRSDRFVF